MKLKVFIFLFLSFSISLYANNSLSVMSYNLENFFDTYDDPGKDDKAYLPLSAKQDQSHIDACNKIRVSKWKNECLYLDWSEENKNKKLNNIVATIRSLDTTPDVIAFQEIENINALKDMDCELRGCDNSLKIDRSNICVYNSHNFIDIKQIIKNNPILLNDNTLPEIDKNIKCINLECKKSPSIKYIKYDFENMKYMYICNHCGETWTNNI